MHLLNKVSAGLLTPQKHLGFIHIHIRTHQNLLARLTAIRRGNNWLQCSNFNWWTSRINGRIFNSQYFVAAKVALFGYPKFFLAITIWQFSAKFNFFRASITFWQFPWIKTVTYIRNHFKDFLESSIYKPKYSAISILWEFWSLQKLSLNCIMSTAV